MGRVLFAASNRHVQRQRILAWMLMGLRGSLILTGLVVRPVMVSIV